MKDKERATLGAFFISSPYLKKTKNKIHNYNSDYNPKNQPKSQPQRAT
jgi:hypothetical protein